MKWIFIVVFGVVSHFANAIEKLQLASNYNRGIDVSQYLVSEKLDGVRGRWNGQEMLTRNGHKIYLPDWFTADFPPLTLDGELWIARGRFEEVSSIARRQSYDQIAWHKVKFMVFDSPELDGRFEQRYETLSEILSTNFNPHLKLIPQFSLTSTKQLDIRLNELVKAGAEGLMLHHKQAKYHHGRSKHLVKLKTYFDAEATVIAIQPGKGKFQGMMGALVVKNDEGLTFKIGTGFNLQERRNPPIIGSRITYKFWGVTSKGKPRFASYFRQRPL